MRMKSVLKWMSIGAACLTGSFAAASQDAEGGLSSDPDEISIPDGRSVISVLQIGQDNIANIGQINPDSAAYANFGQIQQSGSGNSATINQEAVASGLAGTTNISLISQDGFGNVAEIDQTGADNFAEIDQQGNDNYGDILQNGVGLQAVLEQNGENLDYSITQTGCAISGGCPPIIVRQSTGATATGGTSSSVTVTTVTGGGS